MQAHGVGDVGEAQGAGVVVRDEARHALRFAAPLPAHDHPPILGDASRTTPCPVRERFRERQAAQASLDLEQDNAAALNRTLVQVEAPLPEQAPVRLGVSPVNATQFTAHTHF